MRPRPSSARRFYLVWIGLLLSVLVVVGLDRASSEDHRGIMAGLVGLQVIASLLPARYRRPLWSGGMVLAAALLIGLPHWDARPYVVTTTVCNILLLTVASVAYERRFGAGAEPLPAAAEPVPPPEPLQKAASSRLGGLRLELRCLPAPPHGQMIADVCEARKTRFGTRVLVADLAGRSDATRAAADDLLYKWRKAAAQEPGLAEVAKRLDAEFAHHPELFAKALFIEIDETGAGKAICCGSPPPLLLTRGTAGALSFFAPLPPLGLFGLAHGGCSVYATAFSLDADRRLLVYTDGANGGTEADDAGDGTGGASAQRDTEGEPGRLDRRAGDLAGCEPGVLLDRLVSDVRRRHESGGRDEAILMLVEREDEYAGVTSHPDAAESGAELLAS